SRAARRSPARRALAPSPIAACPSCASSLPLRILLVVDVFLPELLLQLRIGLLLRRLPQPARDHIVVAAVGNLTRARAVAGVVVGFLAGLLGLQVTRRIAGLGPTRVPARGRAVRVLRRRLGGGSARGVTALVRAALLAARRRRRRGRGGTARADQ